MRYITGGPSLAMHSLALLIALTSIGCVDTQSTRPLFVFPTRQEMSQLRLLPPPKQVISEQAARADGWLFTEPPATTLGEVPYDDPSPWGRSLTGLVQEHPLGLQLSTALRCQAQELARFYIQRGAPPPIGLRRFIGARCGSIFEWPSVLLTSQEVPPSVSDDEVWRGWQEGLIQKLRQTLPSGKKHSIGWAFQRHAGKALILLLIAEPKVLIEPLSLVVPPDGKFVVRGTLLSPAEHVEALSNAGRFGVTLCQRDRSVPLPRFSLQCQLAPDDMMAWTQVFSLLPEHVLADELLSLLVRRLGADLSHYRSSSSESSQSVDSETFGKTVLVAVNQARGEAKMIPLKLATLQSQTTTDLAPQLFAAQRSGSDFKVANRIVLGLLAGWDVGGTLRFGDLTTSMVFPCRNINEWLDDALEQPSSRRVLLAPDARSIAIGPLVLSEQQALGAVVVTYSFFDGSDHHADTERVMEQLHLARQDHHLPPPVFIRELNTLMETEAQAVAQGADPQQALHRMLRTVAERGFSTKGFVLQTFSLDRVTLPPAMLRAGKVQLGVAVTHHRPLGAAWAHYVAYVVMLDDTDDTAR